MLKHYVEILYPGLLFGETNTKEISNRDPKSVVIPNGAFGFRFMDREEIEATDGEKLKGNNKNISGWYYKGREMTLEDVKREFPEKDILISNMECNSWKTIVWTEFNQAFPLHDGDTVIS